MKAVIQRVTKASVTVDGEVISQIGRGLCILIGIRKDDTKEQKDFLVRKILNLRVFDDENGKRWSKSVKDLDLEILCVSQFTLCHVLKGNKPDFHLAMGGQDSQQFYNDFLTDLKSNYHEERIKDGQFGAMMQVEIINDGPVTLEVEAINEKK